MNLLKQSTAFTETIGPIIDSAGAEYTGAVIGDLSISKNGTEAAMAAAATLTHISNGYYTLVGTTGNSDTLGRVLIRCNKSTYQMPPKEFEVLASAPFDTLVTNGTLASTTSGRTIVVDAAGLADATTVKLGPTGSGTAQTARDIGASMLLSSGTGTGQLKLASGYVAMTWADIAAPTTTVNLSGTTIKTATDVEADTADIQGRLPAALTGAGNMKSDALAIGGNTTVPTSMIVVFDTDFASNYNTTADKWNTSVTHFGGTAGTFNTGIPDVRLGSGITHGSSSVTTRLHLRTPNSTPALYVLDDGGGEAAVKFEGISSKPFKLVASGANPAIYLESAASSAIMVDAAVGYIFDEINSLGFYSQTLLVGVGSIATGAITAASIHADAVTKILAPITIRSGTAQGGASNYIILDSGADDDDNFYVPCWIKLTGGTGSGQFAHGYTYEGASKKLYIMRVQAGGGWVDAWDTDPDSTTTFMLYPASFATDPAALDNVNQIIANTGFFTEYDAGKLEIDIGGKMLGEGGGTIIGPSVWALNQDGENIPTAAENQSGMATLANQAIIIGYIDTEIASILAAIAALPTAAQNAAAWGVSVIADGLTRDYFLQGGNAGISFDVPSAGKATIYAADGSVLVVFDYLSDPAADPVTRVTPT